MRKCYTTEGRQQHGVCPNDATHLVAVLWSQPWVYVCSDHLAHELAAGDVWYFEKLDSPTKTWRPR